jgi:hypothetical protein
MRACICDARQLHMQLAQYLEAQITVGAIGQSSLRGLLPLL